MDSDKRNEFRKEWDEVLRDHGINPEFEFLQCPLDYELLVEALTALSDVQFMLRRIGYEAWADMLDPSLI